jgi:hypothetical protein
MTKNVPPQRHARLGWALAPVRTLLSPRRAWSASALVATALFTLSGPPAQAQAVPALPSSGLVASNPVGAPPASELRELGESIARGESPALSKQAQGVSRSANFANTPWGIYSVHFKDLTLDGGGPNGPNTIQWTYILALQSNGTAELYAEQDLSQYPGYGTTNCVHRSIENVGPNLTATWRVNGSTLTIEGPGYGWQDNSCQPGWHVYRPFPKMREPFTYQFYAGFTAVKLTALDPQFFPKQEGNTFIFTKVAEGPISAAPVGQPAVITYLENRIFAFVTGADGHLGVNWWDGSGWHWADQGTPPGTTASGSPAVITDPAGRIFAFVTGANGHLGLNWWDGSGWHWADQGTPPGTTASGSPGAITYGAGRIFAFVTGADGHLGVNWWDGSGWHWADQGAEP